MQLCDILTCLIYIYAYYSSTVNVSLALKITLPLESSFVKLAFPIYSPNSLLVYFALIKVFKEDTINVICYVLFFT